MKLLLYCTQAKPRLVYRQIPRTLIGLDNSFEGFMCGTLKEVGINEHGECELLNGKVIAECDFEVEKIKLKTNSYEAWFETKTLNEEQLREKSCLRVDELYNYLEPNDNGYAIHIKNLKIFDEPKNIIHYGTNIHYDDEGWTETNTLWKAPSRMMEVYDNKWNHYVYIPMQSQEMCRILNGEQTIIVRKKVLKGMLNNE